MNAKVLYRCLCLNNVYNIKSLLFNVKIFLVLVLMYFKAYILPHIMYILIFTTPIISS